MPFGRAERRLERIQLFGHGSVFVILQSNSRASRDKRAKNGGHRVDGMVVHPLRRR